MVYRRPLEVRSSDAGDLGDLVADVLGEQVSAVLGEAGDAGPHRAVTVPGAGTGTRLFSRPSAARTGSFSLTICLPSGASEIGISLKLASANGIPMIVMHQCDAGDQVRDGEPQARRR